ncbi:MAG: hypothetical protein ABI076_04760 [Acidobacteriaceae bacterium]
MSTTKSTQDSQTDFPVSDRISEAVEQTKSKLTEFGTAAAERIDENRITAASGLDAAADALHAQADHLPGVDKITDVAHAAADKLSATADYVRENDLGRMMDDVEGLVKKNPRPALLIAAGLGFLIARAFSSSSRG